MEFGLGKERHPSLDDMLIIESIVHYYTLPPPHYCSSSILASPEMPDIPSVESIPLPWPPSQWDPADLPVSASHLIIYHGQIYNTSLGECPGFWEDASLSPLDIPHSCFAFFLPYYDEAYPPPPHEVTLGSGEGITRWKSGWEICIRTLISFF